MSARDCNRCAIYAVETASLRHRLHTSEEARDEAVHGEEWARCELVAAYVQLDAALRRVAELERHAPDRISARMTVVSTVLGRVA